MRRKFWLVDWKSFVTPKKTVVVSTDVSWSPWKRRKGGRERKQKNVKEGAEGEEEEENKREKEEEKMMDEEMGKKKLKEKCGDDAALIYVPGASQPPRPCPWSA